MAHNAHSSGRSLKYDGVMAFWRIITQIFFREVRPRGAFNIPRDGPVIFVGAPHNNQVCSMVYVVLGLTKMIYSFWTLYFLALRYTEKPIVMSNFLPQPTA